MRVMISGLKMNRTREASNSLKIQVRVRRPWECLEIKRRPIRFENQGNWKALSWQGEETLRLIWEGIRWPQDLIRSKDYRTFRCIVWLEKVDCRLRYRTKDETYRTRNEKRFQS